MTKERYIAIKNLAIVDRKYLNKQDFSMSKLIEKANENAASFTGNEKQAYIASFLLPDDSDFIDKYSFFSKNITELAKHFSIPRDIIVAKIGAISLYGINFEKANEEESLYILTSQNAFLKRTIEVLKEENERLKNENERLSISYDILDMQKQK